jgi:hypothetical protein
MNIQGLKRNADIKVADETWIATALLHREHPDRADFTVSEIVARAEKEGIYGSLRPGIRVHASLHCVANLPPNPGRYRMLFATGRSTRRLFRRGDTYDRDREGGKIVPERGEIPEEYRSLLDWYRDYNGRSGSGPDTPSTILDLRGLGRGLWSDEDPDAYVTRLREEWK